MNQNDSEIVSGLLRSFPVEAGQMLGISREFESKQRPIHGLRHPPVGNTSGWYIWTGELSDADDFFVPMHIGHLKDLCIEAYNLLGLQPGSRFLLGEEGYIDIWTDESLLQV